MNLFIRLVADLLHTAMMYHICMKIFDKDFNRKKQFWMIAGSIIIFLLMSYKSYIQLDYPLYGRIMEFFLVMTMGWFVVKLTDRTYGESVAMSFLTMIIGVPVYLFVTFIWLQLESTDAIFRQMEFLTSIGLIVIYGGVLYMVASRYGTSLKTVLRKLIINFKLHLLVTFVIMNVVVIGADLLGRSRYLISAYTAVTMSAFTVLLLLILFVVINRKRKLNDIMEHQMNTYQYQSRAIERLCRDLNCFNDTQTRPNYEALREVMVQVQKLNHPVVEGLLMTCVQIASQRKVKVEWEIETELKDLSIEDILLSRTVGVLIENAIEAAAESNDKRVLVKIFSDDKQKIICIENDYKVLNVENDIWQSTKGRNRGNGLKFLKSVIEYYSHITEETHVAETRITKKLIFEVGI